MDKTINNKLHLNQFDVLNFNCSEKEILLLQKLIDEKNNYDLKISEINHRYKNHLQLIISSLRIIQKNGKIDFSDVEEIIYSNLKSWESLSIEESKDLISLKKFLEDLSLNLVSGHNVHIDISTQNILLDNKKLEPIGLIVNEFITNSLKHAFNPKSNSNKKINIFFYINGQNYILMLKDNGIGYKEDMNTLEKITHSNGLKLISSIAKQNKIIPKFESNNGAQLSLFFNKEYFNNYKDV